MKRAAILAVAILFAGHLSAQSVPVFEKSVAPVFSPIARAAHVSGKVIAEFSIASDGAIENIHVISGPEMLRANVVDALQHSSFKTPLPMGVESSYRATYQFGVDQEPEDFSDALDGPLWERGEGCITFLPPSAYAIHGEIRSGNGVLIGKVDAASGLPGQKCAARPQDTAAQQSQVEFIQLEESTCDAYTCGRYRLRVERDGEVTLTPLQGMPHHFERHTALRVEDADELFQRFNRETIWTLCEEKAEPQVINNVTYGSRLTIQIAGRRNRINPDFTDEGGRLGWALLKATGAVEWLRSDFIQEPLGNITFDLQVPKPGLTRLMRAAYRFSTRSGNVTNDGLKQALSAGVDVDAADASGWTPLMLAAYANPEAISILLQAGAHADRASLHGDTPLHFAAYDGRLSKLLLQAGAPINAASADGITPLMLLAQSSGANADDLSDAIKAGADASLKDRAGHTALDYLLADGCGRPYVPHIEPRGMATVIGHSDCPPNYPEFRAKRAVLERAMKR